MHFESSHHSTELPSNHRFGYFFAMVFLLGGLYCGYAGYKVAAAGLAGAGLLLVLVAKFAAAKLTPFSRAWMNFGLLLGRVISPLALGLLFFSLITPVALFLRLIGRDELRLKLKSGQSHWLRRDPPGPPADGFKNQF